MKQKKYLDIERLKGKYMSAFNVGEHIVVQEKLDGANTSVAYDATTGRLVAFSRRRELDEMNTLNGFYTFMLTCDPVKWQAMTDNGRYIVFGEWLCLSGDTVIKKASSGKARNTMTLREMYNQKYTLRSDVGCKRGIRKLLKLLYTDKVEITELNYNTEYGLDKITTINEALQKGYIINQDQKYLITDLGIDYIKDYYFKNSTWGKDGFPSIYSLNLETDDIQTNKMADIFYTGEKEVYKLTTHKGYSIKATKEHKFLTPHGWKSLGELAEFDCVAITDFITRNKHGRSYGKGTRAIIAAQDAYKAKIGKCEKCGATSCLELHHIDENHFNNTEDNWMILCNDCHKKMHTKHNNQPNYDYEFDYIVSIEYAGVEDCYDIAMTGGEDLANFIANNFIVHNCKHTITYPDDMMRRFYVFDVWDTVNERYMSWFFTKQVAAELGLLTVPVFYEGKFTSWEDIHKLVGQTKMGAMPCGEGVVVKSQDRLDDKSSRTPSYVKLVAADFSEIHQSKPHEVDPEKLAARAVAEEIVSTIVNKRRVQKQLETLVDDNIIPADWDEKNMAVIAKNISRMVYNDCMKEEPEIVKSVEDFGKICAKLTMGIVRGFLSER